MKFKAKIEIIGINPYVLLPEKVLIAIFEQAGKEKGPIPVCGKIDGHDFIQTLVKYAGKWRLYLNTPMRKDAQKDVNDTVTIEVKFDPEPRIEKMPPALEAALKKDKIAFGKFNGLTPSRQKEICRYINMLKSDEAIEKNVTKALLFLHGKGRWF